MGSYKMSRYYYGPHDNRTPPENFKKDYVCLSPYDYDGMTVVEAFNSVMESTSHLREGKIITSYGELYISGFVPMTDKEIEAAARRKEASRKSAETRRIKREAAEREKLRKLAKKYPDAT